MQTLALRRYPFENIANFQDLGGYAAANNSMTRWGVFFRSARLTDATASELETLRQLNIRTVLDLRMEQEISMRPDAGMEDPFFGWQHISLLGNIESQGIDIRTMQAHPDQVPPMSTLYQYMIEHNQADFRHLMEVLAEGVQKGAVLFHCTAGKDRTGLTAMFLQAICGVGRLDMIAHYQVSQTYNLIFMPEDTTGSDPHNMITLLDFLQKEHNGPVAYLRDCGVAEKTLQIIREHLLQPC